MGWESGMDPTLMWDEAGLQLLQYPMSLCGQISHRQRAATVSNISQLQKVTQSITCPEIPSIIITAHSGR